MIFPLASANNKVVFALLLTRGYASLMIFTVLRIFGIFKHAQMDKNRLWESVTAHMIRRGKEYRRRFVKLQQDTVIHFNRRL